MEMVIDEYWITTIGGLVIFHQKSKDVEGKLEIGALLTAINNFITNVIDTDKVDVLEMEKNKYLFLKSEEYKLILVGRASSEEKIKIAKKFLLYVKDKFLEVFAEKLVDFQGEVLPFQSFVEIIDLDKDKNNFVHKIRKLKW